MISIALSGKARSGKDTIAAYLIRRYGFTKIALAQPIKAALAAMLSAIPGIENYLTDAGKETIIPPLGVSFRRLAQTLGSEWGRELIHPDIWIILADLSMKKAQTSHPEARFVITDLRFSNEAVYVHDNHFDHWWVQRDTAYYNVESHPSECGVSQADCNFTIANTGSLHDLEIQVDQRLQMLGIYPTQ
jgi:hypothetical protein